MRFKRSFTEPVPKRREDDFGKAGIAAFHGTARFAAQTTVEVGEETLAGRYVVIATGQIPADLEIPGAEHLTTSDQFLELDEPPRGILFPGRSQNRYLKGRLQGSTEWIEFEGRA
jgi:glutathione reductase (NADPH)